MEEFADHMQGAEGASGSVTIVDIVKQLGAAAARRRSEVGADPGEPEGDRPALLRLHQLGRRPAISTASWIRAARYGTVITLFRGYSHDIIMNSIAYGKRFADGNTGSEVEFRFAGGLFGILAAVNEAVENSYWTNLGLIFFMVYLLPVPDLRLVRRRRRC